MRKMTGKDYKIKAELQQHCDGTVLLVRYGVGVIE